jgi:sulfide dehydrogenase cytochrome subunit
MKARLIVTVLACALASAVQAQDAGRFIAANCANCHGTNGVSLGGIPALAGRDKAEIARLMKEFKEGKRPATIMQQLSKGYTDEQIETVAAFFAAQKVK